MTGIALDCVQFYFSLVFPFSAGAVELLKVPKFDGADTSLPNTMPG